MSSSTFGIPENDNSFIQFSILCHSCQDIFRGDKLFRDVHPHSRYFTDLEASARKGCHLCTTIWNDPLTERHTIDDGEQEYPMFLPGWEVSYTLISVLYQTQVTLRFNIWKDNLWESRWNLELYMHRTKGRFIERSRKCLKDMKLF